MESRPVVVKTQFLHIYATTILTNAEIEVLRYGHVVENIDEIGRYTDIIIKDILNTNFSKNEIKEYSTDCCFVKKNANVYSLDWTVKPRKIDKLSLLTNYCAGSQVKILSGEHEGAIGVYCLLKKQLSIPGFKEYVGINGVLYDLSDFTFEFVDGNTQLAWESIWEK